MLFEFILAFLAGMVVCGSAVAFLARHTGIADGVDDTADATCWRFLELSLRAAGWFPPAITPDNILRHLRDAELHR